MSVVYCHYCNKYIDTDYDLEHFVNEELDYCIEEEEKDENEN